MATVGVEKQYYDQLFTAVDTQGTGVLPGKDVLPFLTSSGLPPQTLGEIWAIADPDNNGFLTRQGWYKAARIIGWAQKGHAVDAALASKSGPFPTFKGYPSPPAAPEQGRLSANTTGTSSTLPPLTPADRTKFTRIFVGCGPTNGFVSGDKARDVFLKSQLSYDKLGQIWNLADTQQRGALDLTDFIIGMYLIQSSMANPSLVLPTTLPPGTYEAASGGRPAPSSPPPHLPTSPVQRQLTGTLQPQLTGQSLRGAATPPRSVTFASAPSEAGPAWDVTPDAKAASDRFFAQLDTQNKGVIEGDVAVPFMLQSQLDEGTLASIWDLADIRQEGKLDRDEFAVAMHLINAKLAGKELPATLPTSLIPPRLRSQVPGGAPGVGMPAAAPAPTKDLFDLFDDDAAAPAAPSLATAFLPQPPSRRSTTDTASSRQIQPQAQPQPQPQSQSSFQSSFASPFQSAPRAQPAGDLLGEDSQETPSAVLDQSADLGNKRNQLANTTRANAELEKTRSELEQNAASTATQLSTLEAELSAARMKNENETKIVADLRIRVGEQTAKLKQLQAEVISAESDVNAMRLEKQELEQALMNDKEEVRGLQRRMKELEDEKTGLKLLLEKIRKEARQQKGMVTIAKKQVSTAEASRDGVQKEIRDAEAEVEEAQQQLRVASASPTARALSPEATGNSRGSMNPFDRLNRTVSGTSDHSPTPSHPGAAAAFAGGAAATGLVGAFVAAHHKDESGDQSPSLKQTTPPKETTPPAVSTEDTNKDDVDPFGMPASASSHGPHETAGASGFGGPDFSDTSYGDSGFGDSFAAPAPAAAGGVSDFDAAFADFDSGAEVPDVVEPLPTVAHNQNLDLQPAPERTVSTQAVPPSSAPRTPLESPHEEPTTMVDKDVNDESSDEDEGPEDLEAPRRDFSRSISPPASDRPASLSAFTSNAAPAPAQPAPPTAASPAPSPSAALAPSPPTEDAHKTRRSAPPPPTSRTGSHASQPTLNQSPPAETLPAVAPTVPAESATPTPEAPHVAPAAHASPQAAPDAVAELDPFGAPITAQTAATPATPADPFGAPFLSNAFPAPPATDTTGHTPFSVPKTSMFDDDDDFDFPEIPHNTGNATAASASNPIASSAFDDEFASFDDDFDKPPSQVQTSSDKSYDIVSPQGIPPQDEWGMPKNAAASTSAAPASSALSFDDAFGGDFSPVEASKPGPSTGPAHAPAPGAAAPAPDAAATPPPPLPQRPDADSPQPDDLEDVKKLCGMGFPRSLVVEALDANGYSFQKALNVLLDK